MAIFRVEKDKNYTVMSNFHLRDQTLSLKAKGLLSIMLSLPESWDYTTRGLAHISKEGESAITSTLKELEERGYLTRRRLRNEQGHLCETEFTIHEKSTHGEPEKKQKKVKKGTSPNLDYPRLEKCPVGEKPVELGDCDEEELPSPDLGYPYLDNPDMDNPDVDFPREEEPNLENRRQLSTYKKNKNRSSTQSNQYQSNQSQYNGIDMDWIEAQRQRIKDNIEFNSLILQYGEARTKEIVEIILEKVCSTQETVRISGNDYPTGYVRDRFLSLTFSHIQYVFGCMDENKSDIRNIKAYLLTTLFNANATIDHYYTAKVNHDMG